jgi:hypothetical protein
MRAAASMRTKSEGGIGAEDLGSVDIEIGHDDASRGRLTLRAERCWRVGGRLNQSGVARAARVMEGWAT